MRNRIAGQTLIEKIMAEQDARPPRSAIATIFGVSPIRASESAWYEAALGDQAVATSLGGLPDGWHAFHSLPIGSAGAAIDHVVVGPPGIFAISAQRYRGKEVKAAGSEFLVNGRRESHIAVAAAGAESVTRTLHAQLEETFPVHGIVAVVAPKQFAVTKLHEDVAVVHSEALRLWLLKRPSRLASQVVTEIAAVLNNPATWRITPVVDHTELSCRFADLAKRARRAAVVRTVWLSAACLVVIALCWVLVTKALGLWPEL